MLERRRAPVMKLSKTHSLALMCSLAAGAFGLAAPTALAQSGTAAATISSAVKRADFRGTPVSRDVQHIADWAVHSGDHQGLPFIIVDKVTATLSAFDASGR